MLLCYEPTTLCISVHWEITNFTAIYFLIICSARVAFWFFFFFPHCLCVLPPFLWVGHMHVCMRQPFDSSWFAPLSLSISEIFASLGNKWSLIWWQFLLWVIIWATFFLPLLFPIRFFFFSFLSGSFRFFGCGTRSSSGLGVRDQYEPLIFYLILFLIKKKKLWVFVSSVAIWHLKGTKIDNVLSITWAIHTWRNYLSNAYKIPACIVNLVDSQTFF